MKGVEKLRFGVVPTRPDKPLHRRLQAFLRAQYKAGRFDQTSFGQAVGKTQSTAGQYLTGTKAGSLDLDEAVAALEHAGSSLNEFLAGAPPRELTHAEIVGRSLVGRPDLIPLVEALLAVPKTRLHVVRGLISSGYFVATGRRLKLPDGSDLETREEGRTTEEPE